MRRPWAVWVWLVVVLVMAGCGSKSEPPPVPPVPTSLPTAVMPPALASRGLANGTQPQPIPGWPATIDLGLMAGDGYVPTSLTVDQEEGLAYVYTGMSPQGTSGVSVINLESQQVVRRYPLIQPEIGGGEGQIFLHPNGARLYVVESGNATLLRLELTDGTVITGPTDVQRATLSPDGSTLYVVRTPPQTDGAQTGSAQTETTQIQALDATTWALKWEIPVGYVDHMIATAQALLVSQSAEQRTLNLYAPTDGHLMAEHEVAEYVDGVAAGPDGEWAVRLSGDPPRLRRYDAMLQPQQEMPAPYGRGLFYDAPRHRYLLSGTTLSTDPAMPSQPILLTLDPINLIPLTQVVWPRTEPPDRFALVENGSLLALRLFGEERLYTIDTATLHPTAAIPLGIRLRGLAADDKQNLLYVTDNQEHIHRLDLATGMQEGLFSGSTPMALDSANHILYVNQQDDVTGISRVVALDSETGATVASFAQAGFPAPDPQRDLVYIVQGGVTAYTRQGKLIGRLESSFPTSQEPVPNPGAVSAVVNPVSGSLIVVMNNGVPGSNNRNNLRVYPPLQNGNLVDTPVEPPALDHLLSYFAFDTGSGPGQGELYTGHNSFRAINGLQVLDQTGNELRRLYGRGGPLAYDPTREILYVAGDGALALFSGPTLTLQALTDLAPDVTQLAISQPGGLLIVRRRNQSTLQVVNPDQLPPLSQTPTPLSALPPGRPTGLHATAEGLYLVLGGQLFFSETGREWSQLHPGTPGVNVGYLTVVEPDTLYWTAYGPVGGDGVLRSADGGASWQLLSAGLTDLMGQQAVAATDSAAAYFLTRSGVVQAWQPEGQKWTEQLSPTYPFEDPGRLHLSPWGEIYLAAWGRLRGSTDGGATWSERNVPADAFRLLGFSETDQTQLLFALQDDEIPQLWRSADGGQSWLATEVALPLPAYASLTYFFATTQTIYLICVTAEEDLLLLRSLDQGLTWAQAEGGALPPIQVLDMGPDGHFWVGYEEEGIVNVDPTTLVWQPVLAQERAALPAAAVAEDEPAPTPTLPAACPEPLDGIWRVLADAHPELGCATGEAHSVAIAFQPFERGSMIWREDSRTILVLQANGEWQAYADSWVEGDVESDPALQPPEARLLQPIRGFGQIWRTELGGPESGVGWATAEEEGLDAQIREFDQGSIILLDLGRAYVLSASGQWWQN